MSADALQLLWGDGAPWHDEIAQWSQRREQALLQLNRLIEAFIRGEVALVDFASELDSFSKREPHWGWRGHSGQMFLNVLMRAADHSRLEDALRSAIVLPTTEPDAEAQMTRFMTFVEETKDRAQSVGRYVPKLGYIPYFLSFFWESQDRSWPIYYPRSRRALVRYGLFREAGDLPSRYLAYRREVLRLSAEFRTTVWGVEVFLFGITADEEAARLVRSRKRPVSIAVDEDYSALELLEHIEQPIESFGSASVNILLNEVAATSDQVATARAEQIATRRESQAYFEAISLGFDIDDVSLPRFVPVVLFVSSTEGSAAIELAVLEFLEVFDIVIADEFPPVRTSWFRRFTGRTRELLTKPEVQTRMEEAERALQVRAVDLPQAQVDLQKAEAAAKLITAVESQTSVAIQVGSILLLKNAEALAVRDLQPHEMLKLSRDPSLLKSPDELLQILSQDAPPLELENGGADPDGGDKSQ